MFDVRVVTRAGMAPFEKTNFSEVSCEIGNDFSLKTS